MNLTCEHARGLVAGYLDGELSAERSHALREHLLECRSCREVAKDERLLKRWFAETRAAAPPASLLVPQGFAARVARRAFAGDPGTREPALPEPTRPTRAEALAGEREGSLLPFLLKSVLVAAGLLFALAIGIQERDLPREDLRAQPAPPWERADAEPAPDLDLRGLPAEEAERGKPAAEEERTELANDPASPPRR